MISTTAAVRQHDQQHHKPIIVHCNSSGARADGTGSGFAWIRLDTSEAHIALVNGLTANVAECRAILSALRLMPKGATVCICSCSEVTCNQLNGLCSVSNPTLANLHGKIASVLHERQLTVTAKWIPKMQNLADKMLKRMKLQA